MKGLIILDFNRTLYDPDSERLVDGALDFLRSYSKTYALALIGKGDDRRASLIEELEIRKYFKHVQLNEEKEEADFTDCMKRLSFNPGSTWSVGDRIKKEIRLSNRSGIKTIWLRTGKFASEGPELAEEEPMFTVSSFREIAGIIPL